MDIPMEALSTALQLQLALSNNDKPSDEDMLDIHMYLVPTEAEVFARPVTAWGRRIAVESSRSDWASASL